MVNCEELLLDVTVGEAILGLNGVNNKARRVKIKSCLCSCFVRLQGGGWSGDGWVGESFVVGTEKLVAQEGEPLSRESSF